ncbi:MlaD family protein [Telmatospirillum sp. J64-1]|uniref:MlaD family protein n=1 Tax=Telmatospirillum sp. J64-1 TaxID=2502183 RepID=UPI00115E554C|nr:MlaD family protein [Telmatospirillum sp. J64-1]
MKDSRINYVAVGAFVLAMVAALVVAVALLAGRTGPTETYYANFNNVSGVRPGTAVMFEGYPIGQVERIEPFTENGRVRFRLALAVTRDWRIPEDSRANIAASGLLSAVAVDIRGGAAPEILPPGSVIPSSGGGNLFAVMSEVATQVGDLTEGNLRPLLATLERSIANVSAILEEQAPDLLGNLVAVAADLATKTPQITDNVRNFSNDLNQVLTEENRGRIDQTLANMASFSGNMEQLGGQLATTGEQVDQLIASLNALIETNSPVVTQSVRDLAYTLQRVSSDIDTITGNLESTSRNMSEFSREIRQNPARVFGGDRGGVGQGPAR